MLHSERIASLDEEESTIASVSLNRESNAGSPAHQSPILAAGPDSPVLPVKSTLQLNEFGKEGQVTEMRSDCLLRTPSHNKKSRSMTSAEIAAEYASPQEVAQVAERLRTEGPPMSLDQARLRRASIKEERRASIEFIRHRTSSRAAQLGRPPEGITLKPTLTEGVVFEGTGSEENGARD